MPGSTSAATATQYQALVVADLLDVRDGSHHQDCRRGNRGSPAGGLGRLRDPQVIPRRPTPGPRETAPRRDIRGCPTPGACDKGTAVDAAGGWRHLQCPMYVVIMAGGGGTRLRPLSTAARPKPFLPLLPTGETLLERTVARLRGPELGLSDADICVVTSSAYAPLVRATGAGDRRRGGAGGPQHGRGDRVGDPRGGARRRRRHGRPAGRSPDRPGAGGPVPLRAARGRGGTGNGGLRRGVAARDAGHPAHAPVDRTTATWCRAWRPAGTCEASRPTRWLHSARSPARPTRRPWWHRPAWPGMRACSCGGGGRSAPPWSATRPSARRRGGRPRLGRPRGGLSAPALALDRLRGDGAGRRGRRGRHGRPRRRLERRRDLAGAARGSRRTRTWAAASSRRATTIDAGTAGPARRTGQRWAGRPRGVGKMVALDPIAHLRGAHGARPLVQALLDRCAAAEART